MGQSLLVLVCPILRDMGLRGFSDIFIHTYALVIFLGFKILNFNIFWVFRKKKHFFFGGGGV